MSQKIQLSSKKKFNLYFTILVSVLTFFSNKKRIIQRRDVDLVINLPNKNTKFVKENYLIRRAAVDYGIAVISNLQVRFHFI
jgi:hypothetical protein